MTSVWTAPSDLDYYEGDLPPSEKPEERDPEYEAWLETHGYLDPPSDRDLELMRVEHEQRNPPAAIVPRIGMDEDDDIAF